MSAAVLTGARLGFDILHEAFEQSAVGLAVASLDGQLVEVNRAFCALLGYDRQDVQGQHGTFGVAALRRRFGEDGAQFLRQWHDGRGRRGGGGQAWPADEVAAAVLLFQREEQPGAICGQREIEDLT